MLLLRYTIDKEVFFMIKLVLNELSNLSKPNKLITFSILSISLIFTIIAGVIFGVKQLQTVYTYYLALDMFQTATVLFLEGITIGVLLNLIAKRKKEEK